MSITGLQEFHKRVAASIDEHPIVRSNSYTSWFSRGEFSRSQLRDFTTQFSVFGHLFLEAQLRKVLNAPTLATYRASKEILLNELGVTFSAGGSIDGEPFRFTAAHFEWLVAFAAHLGLEFEELGKRKVGSAATLHFCSILRDVYGSDDPSESAGASYAIEHWAAAGFWKDLIAGLRIFKRRELPSLPLGFWTWHDRLEETHAAHTEDELSSAFHERGFGEQRFLTAGVTVLDAVAFFWEGLDLQRQRSEPPQLAVAN